MYDAFNLVYFLLENLAKLTGLSYKAINIILFYGLLPLLYFALLDRLLKKHYFKLVFILGVFLRLVLMESFEAFAVGLFDDSVIFLKNFQAIGWSYTEASVIICVIFPFLILMLLLFLVIRQEVLKNKREV